MMAVGRIILRPSPRLVSAALCCEDCCEVELPAKPDGHYCISRDAANGLLFHAAGSDKLLRQPLRPAVGRVGGAQRHA